MKNHTTLSAMVLKLHSFKKCCIFVYCFYFLKLFGLGRRVPVIEICKEFSDDQFAKNVDIILGATVHLECNFCNKKDDFLAKLWYYKGRGTSLTTKEVDFSMKSNTTDSKYILTISHKLIIRNFSLNDCGIYSCQYNYRNDDNFIYVLDGVTVNRSVIRFVKPSQWLDYKKNKLDQLNEKIHQAENEPFRSINITLQISFKIITVWDTWGRCEVQGKRTKGIHRKIGKCYIQPVLGNNFQKTATNRCLQKIKDYFSEDIYLTSCHSLTLNIFLPELCKVTDKFPDFEMTETCETSVINEGLVKETNEYKYKDTKHIGENSHVTLVCPEASLESIVNWYKDSDLLNSSFRNNMAKSELEPFITIDSYNTLYILHATKNEEAVYTCTVDGEKMKMIKVIVVSKSKLLNQEFIRYSIYLGFVLSLTLTCYCAGICVAWHRRSSFADPLQLLGRRKAASMLSERDKLLS